MSVYTVSELAGLSGVSVRTLHHYDEIGLLKPATVGQNGYRYYGESELLRLQQILFQRELGLRLEDIRCALDAPDAPAYRVLADMYADHPDFRARYEGRATGFADYLVAAMRAFAESRLS